MKMLSNTNESVFRNISLIFRKFVFGIMSSLEHEIFVDHIMVCVDYPFDSPANACRGFWAI